MIFSRAIDRTKTVFNEWSHDNGIKLAAALAYYTVFSLPPLFVIAIATARLFVSPDQARDQLMHQVGGILGPQGAQALQGMIEATYQQQSQESSVIATIIGIVALVFGASGVFVELQDSMNLIWKADADRTAGWRAFLRQRLFSFSMVLTGGFLLTVSLIMSAVISSVADNMRGNADLTQFWELVDFGISLGTTGMVFSLLFRFVPDTDVRWRDAWKGGFLTAVLFTIGKTVIGIYLGKSGIGTMFGAAGSILLIFAWVYYTAQILFFGVEFTKVSAGRLMATQATGSNGTTTASLLVEDQTTLPGASNPAPLIR